MKISESWLRSWTNPDLSTKNLAHKMTMIGLEANSIFEDGKDIEKIIIAKLITIEEHPNADKLKICNLAINGKKQIKVVCGATNILCEKKYPLAIPGTKLPNGIIIQKSKIRGVISNGMLCSESEIGLGEDADGIMELPDDAPTGKKLINYLELPDSIFDIDIMPNRGDCFSVLGIAREVSLFSKRKLKDNTVSNIKQTIEDTYEINVKKPKLCPRFSARIFKNIKISKTPLWLIERLRKSGIRSIHPIVDVTNYVMIELGQPLHAYDLSLLDGPIVPRYANDKETITLLDGQNIRINKNTVVVADDSGAIGLAGIMGGSKTSVSGTTKDILLEAAFWPTGIMSGQARSYGLQTDASMRFERGVDPYLQIRSLERASQLLMEITNCDVGPLIDVCDKKYLPQSKSVELHASRLKKILGTTETNSKVYKILSNLGFKTKKTSEGWNVTVPSYRFDINIEDDLIEEIVRFHGFHLIPEITADVNLPLVEYNESEVDIEKISNALVNLDYQEIITYSFINPELNILLTGNKSKLQLKNPISPEMSAMRESLLPGLILTAQRNISRQQQRVRIFEVGRTFRGTLSKHNEILTISGLALGSVASENWSDKKRSLDYYDIKGDIESLLNSTSKGISYSFVASQHPSLQVGQAADIFREGKRIGMIGKLHPSIAKNFDLKVNVFIFELNAEESFYSPISKVQTISKFPYIRRDLSLVVDENITASELVNLIKEVEPELVNEIIIFDIYRGKGVEEGRKSIALGLILQEKSRTLTDLDADNIVKNVLVQMKNKFSATLRE